MTTVEQYSSKDLRELLVPGAVLTLPLASQGYSVGLVTFVGRMQSMIGVFCVANLSRPPDLAGAIEVLCHADVWMTRFGFVGFKEDGWQILGKVALPRKLLAQPVFALDRDRVYEFDPQTYDVVTVRPQRDDDLVMDDFAPGSLYIARRLERLVDDPQLARQHRVTRLFDRGDEPPRIEVDEMGLAAQNKRNQ